MWTDQNHFLDKLSFTFKELYKNYATTKCEDSCAVLKFIVYGDIF